MDGWTPIQYCGFWDVPRIFLARYRGQCFLFDCHFDQQLDDYPDSYEVYLLPAIDDGDLPKDWTTLSNRALRQLGSVPVEQIMFDPTKRQMIETKILADLYDRKVAV
jgi:hypothetical protein